MIAAITVDGAPCVIRWVGPRGFRVVARTYCDRVEGVNKRGVLQIPDNAKICAQCAAKIRDAASQSKAGQE